MEQLLTTEKAFGCSHSFVLVDNAIRLMKEFDPDETDKAKVEKASAWLKLLNFPAIARTFSYSDVDGKCPSITSEFVPGDSIQRLDKAKLRLTDSQMLIVAYGIARAFGYMASMKQKNEEAFQDLTYVVRLNKDLEPFVCDLGFDWYTRKPGEQRGVRCELDSYADLLNEPAMQGNAEPGSDAGHPLAAVMEMCREMKGQDRWEEVILALEKMGGCDTEFLRYKQALNRKVSEGSWPEEGLLSGLEHGVPVDLSIDAELLNLAFRKIGNNRIADMYKHLCDVNWNYPTS